MTRDKCQMTMLPSSHLPDAALLIRCYDTSATNYCYQLNVHTLPTLRRSRGAPAPQVPALEGMRAAAAAGEEVEEEITGGNE